MRMLYVIRIYPWGLDVNGSFFLKKYCFLHFTEVFFINFKAKNLENFILTGLEIHKAIYIIAKFLFH